MLPAGGCGIRVLGRGQALFYQSRVASQALHVHGSTAVSRQITSVALVSSLEVAFAYHMNQVNRERIVSGLVAQVALVVPYNINVMTLLWTKMKCSDVKLLHY